MCSAPSDLSTTYVECSGLPPLFSARLASRGRVRFSSQTFHVERDFSARRNYSFLFRRELASACRFGECEVPGRLRSLESTQSSGGNPIRQKSGDASVNSRPTSVLLPLFSLMKATLHSTSSAVFGFTIDTCCPRETGAASEIRHPCAFTVVVFVSSWKGLPALVPRTITDIRMCTRCVRRSLP